MEVFGQTADGETVHRVQISDGTLTASVLDWGATVQDLRLQGHAAPLVLGYRSFEDYLANSAYFGATAGRVANRIGGGRFKLDGHEFTLERNFLDKHSLHSGNQGVSHKIWRIVAQGDAFVRLEIIDDSMEGGFPGTVKITNEYRIERGALHVLIQATTDAPTLVNVVHHSYFNLEDGGATDCLEHQLKIAAEAITELDDELIPTGALNLVAGTNFDFRQFSPIRRDTKTGQFVHDANYCVSAARTDLRPVAWAKAPRSGIELEVSSTEPGMQLYTGAYLAGQVSPGLNGKTYDAFAGFCFEAQYWPDAPNHAHFPSIELRPGQTYAQLTVYAFNKA